MASLTVWGIDIGNSAVKAVKMSRSGDQVYLDDYRVIPIEYSENDDNRAQRVMDALGQLAASADFKKNYAYVSIAGNLALFKEFVLDEVAAAKDVKKVIEFEAKQQIAIPLDEVEWRHQMYEQDGKKGVMIVAVRKSIISELVEQFDKFNIRLAGITAAPIALTNFIQYEYNPEGAVTLLDSGMRSTDFVVLDGKHLFFRPLGIAGKEITQAVMEIFKFDHTKAEDLKKKINSMQPKQAEKIMKKVDPLLRSLASEVHRSIGFYKSKNKGVKIGKLFLFGYTFRLPEMADIIARQVREAPALLIEAPQRLRLGSGVDQKKFDEDFPGLPVAIGLGLQGLGEKSIDINLSNLKPPEETEEAKNRSMWLAIGGVGLLLASLVAGYFTSGHAKALKTELTQAETYEKLLVKARTDAMAIFQSPPAPHLPIGEELNLQARLVALSKDSTAARSIYDRISHMKVFSDPSATLKLVDVAISRVPPSFREPIGTPTNTGMIPEIKAADQRLQKMYSFMADAPTPPAGAPELAISPPLVVVLTVESFGTSVGANDPFTPVRSELAQLGIVRSLSNPHEAIAVTSDLDGNIPYLSDRNPDYHTYKPDIEVIGPKGPEPTPPTTGPVGVSAGPDKIVTTGARLGFVYFSKDDNLPPATTSATTP
ncbi:MAG: pilus assembly protein PilM [Planctomycetota bacterium]